MKNQDSERVFHPTFISDKSAKPLLGKLSGVEIIVFLGSIILAVIAFTVLRTKLGFTVLPSLTVGLLPFATYAILTHFVSDKPEGYISCWFESRSLRKSNTPLLSPTQTDEN